MPSTYIRRILEASVYDVAVETPIHGMPLLSEALGNQVLIKREDLQPVFSFKLRGAYNKISRLSPAEQRRGVITASAGNHAQGVAMAAAQKRIKATIIMPRTTPQIKVGAVKRLGGKVILQGERFDESCQYAQALAREKNYIFVHPYDDPDVIAGQGTIAMEILRQHSEPIHAVFIPVGGGGLIAGMAAYIKYLRPEIRVIGVEAEDSACFTAALRSGRRVVLPHTGIFTDGVAVAQIGKETFRVARQCVDEVVTATTDEVCAAVKEVFDDTRSIAEPAGALSVAGMKNYVKQKRLRNHTLIAIESGANVNFERLRYISERHEIGERTEIILAASMPERTGSLMRFCRALKAHDITEFNYRYHAGQTATVYVRVQVQAEQRDRRTLFAHLKKQGFGLVDLSDNELAKTHVGHMVGGHAGGVENEVLYRVEMPECQGALRKFLSLLEPTWNISLFHYRKTGGANAHVFVGLQIPPGKRAGFEKRMKQVRYTFYREQANPAYEIFLS